MPMTMFFSIHVGMYSRLFPVYAQTELSHASMDFIFYLSLSLHPSFLVQCQEAEAEIVVHFFLSLSLFF